MNAAPNRSSMIKDAARSGWERGKEHVKAIRKAVKIDKKGDDEVQKGLKEETGEGKAQTNALLKHHQKEHRGEHSDYWINIKLQHKTAMYSQIIEAVTIDVEKKNYNSVLNCRME